MYECGHGYGYGYGYGVGTRFWESNHIAILPLSYADTCKSSVKDKDISLETACMETKKRCPLTG